MTLPHRDISRIAHRVVDLSRLQALGDAVFAFALTLLALDLRLPQVQPDTLAQAMLALLPKLLVFVFAFLVIAQEWDVHQRTMMHVARADGTYLWLYLLSLMFVVLMPATADMLGRYPLQPLALIAFGVNIALFCLTSWTMWQHASRSGRLLDEDVKPSIVKLIARLWLYPPLTIAITLPFSYINVFPVYAIWLLMPIVSYSYTTWAFRRMPNAPS